MRLRKLQFQALERPATVAGRVCGRRARRIGRRAACREFVSTKVTTSRREAAKLKEEHEGDCPVVGSLISAGAPCRPEITS